MIPATGFYEWTKDSEGTRFPWYIRSADDAPLAFAGVWQVWEKGEEPLVTCAIVTTGANEAMSTIHHRMPVILHSEMADRWLAGSDDALAASIASMPGLQAWPVDRAVNNPRHEGDSLIIPRGDIHHG